MDLSFWKVSAVPAAPMKSLSVGRKLGQETPARRFVGDEVTLVSFQSHTGQFAGYRTSKDQSAGMRAIYKRSKRLRLRIGSDPGAVRDAMQLTITKVAVRRAQRQSNKRLERALSRDQGDQGRACLGSALDLRSHERSGLSANSGGSAGRTCRLQSIGRTPAPQRGVRTCPT